MSTFENQVLDVIKHAEAQGWRAARSNSNHHQLYPPQGIGVVTVPQKCGESHTFQNFLAAMKRYGYQPPDDRADLLAKRAEKAERQTARVRIEEYARANPDAVVTPQDLVTITGLGANTVQGAIGKLWSDGILRKLQHGQYQLDPSHALPAPEPVSPEVPVALPEPTAPEPPPLPLADEGARIVDDLLALVARVEAWAVRVSEREARVTERERKLRDLLHSIESEGGAT